MNTNPVLPTRSRKQFSLRSLLVLTLVFAFCLVVLAQRRENQELHDRLDAISSQLNELRGTDERLRENHSELEELVRNPPVRILPLALH